MSTFVQIEEPYRPLFRALKLDSFPALMHEPLGEVVSREGDRRTLIRFALPGEDGPMGFYLKRLGPEPLSRLLKVLLFARRPHSGPLREKLLLAALQRSGFAVMEPVAWGEQRRWGIPVGGFLVVKEILGDDVATLYATSPHQERARLLREAGRLVGQLHAAGFFQPVRLKDLILERSSGQMTIIDRETGKPWSGRFSRKRAQAALGRTIRRTLRDGHRFGPAGCRGFLCGYVDGIAGSWPVSVAELRREVFASLRRELSETAALP